MTKENVRVAVYCRVQEAGGSKALRLQAESLQKIVAEHPGWTLAGTFSDRANGTDLAKLPQLNRLLELCDGGGVDLILAVSVTRIGRNRSQVLRCLQWLKERRIGVIFQKEQIDTRKNPLLRI